MYVYHHACQRPFKPAGACLLSTGYAAVFHDTDRIVFGGFLADNVFEPFMQSDLPLQKLFSNIVGSGSGSGMAIIFLLTGIAGVLSSLFSLRNKAFKELDAD